MLGLNKTEINQLINSLNDEKYEPIYRQLIQEYKPGLDSQTPASQNAILWLNEFSGKYINNILQPLIIDVIETNNKKIEEQLHSNS